MTPHKRLRLRLVAGLLVPLTAFLVLERSLGNPTVALALSDAIPLAWVVVVGVRQRRVEPIGVVPAAVFAIALVLSIALGGNSLPLELRRSVFPGALGLACLISVAVHRPFLTVAAARVVRMRTGQTDLETKLDTPDARKTMTVLTAIIGVACLADAIAQVVLALTVSTSTFAVVARIASYAIIGTGLAACAVYLRVRRGSFSPALGAEPSPPARADHQPHAG